MTIQKQTEKKMPSFEELWNDIRHIDLIRNRIETDIDIALSDRCMHGKWKENHGSYEECKKETEKDILQKTRRNSKHFYSEAQRWIREVENGKTIYRGLSAFYDEFFEEWFQKVHDRGVFIDEDGNERGAGTSWTYYRKHACPTGLECFMVPERTIMEGKITDPDCIDRSKTLFNNMKYEGEENEIRLNKKDEYGNGCRIFLERVCRDLEDEDEVCWDVGRDVKI